MNKSILLQNYLKLTTAKTNKAKLYKLLCKFINNDYVILFLF